jgi:hypothetical protein
VDTKQYPPPTLSRSEAWREITRDEIARLLRDPIISKLLSRSNLTVAQFETLLIDQLGHDMANKKLTREEMAQVMRNKKGISRGALNRTLKQARENTSEAIHTVLLLGYGGLIQSASLMPFVDASEQLRNQVAQLKELSSEGAKRYSSSIEVLLSRLEEAFEALYNRDRDA